MNFLGRLDRFRTLAFYQPDAFGDERRCIDGTEIVIGIAAARKGEHRRDTREPGRVSEGTRDEIAFRKARSHPDRGYPTSALPERRFPLPSSSCLRAIRCTSRSTFTRQPAVWST